MWWKNDGFFLIELLLSLTILLMLSLFFTPLFIDLAKQSKLIEVKKQAEQFINEELEALIINEHPSFDHSINLNGIQYQITWINDGPARQQEVCVKIENSSHSPVTAICRSAE